MLEEAGQPEDAADLFTEARAWDELGRLIRGHAPALLEQGRSLTLKKWLDAFPPELGARSPWLLYWRGACDLPVNPGVARRHFEEAYSRFAEQGDNIGALLAGGGVIETYVID